MLVQLEAADIIGRGGIGCAAQKRSKAPNVPDVVLLGVPAQTAHQHVLLHALAKRSGGSGRR